MKLSLDPDPSEGKASRSRQRMEARDSGDDGEGCVATMTDWIRDCTKSLSANLGSSRDTGTTGGCPLYGRERGRGASKTYDAAAPADDLTDEAIVDGAVSADTSDMAGDIPRRGLQSGESSSGSRGRMLRRVSDIAGN